MAEREELVYNPRLQSTSYGMVLAVVAVIFLLGGVAGGLYYAWEVSPVIEQNTRPDQLRDEFQLDYIAAIALDFGEERNRDRTYALLTEVDPNADPFQLAADAVCEMTERGRVQTTSDITIIRNLIAFFSVQPSLSVRCDIRVFATSNAPQNPTPTLRPPNTPTPAPVSTKTPTPPVAAPPTATLPPSTQPATRFDGDFRIVQTIPACSEATNGLLQIFVEQANTGNGIPAVPIEVRWSTVTGQRQQRFFTGLKPERDPGFADFQMETGTTYQVLLPGLSDLSQRLEADECSPGVTRSYQVIFRSP